MPLRPASSASQVSRVPTPSGLTRPTPVRATRRKVSVRGMEGRGGARGRSVAPGGVLLDVVYRLAHAADLLRVLVGDLDVEFLFERHHQLDDVERVGAQAVGE